MVGIFEIEIDKEVAKNKYREKTLKIMKEARDLLILMNLSYRKKIYKQTIKFGYESSMLVAEAIASFKGFEIRKRDCHLQSSIILKQYKDEFSINEKDIAMMEEIRPLRNFFVHPENHYEKIEGNEKYFTTALFSKKASASIYRNTAKYLAKQYSLPLSYFYKTI
jgi:hypothetical protein